jgi:hypothetical protein
MKFLKKRSFARKTGEKRLRAQAARSRHTSGSCKGTQQITIGALLNAFALKKIHTGDATRTN